MQSFDAVFILFQAGHFVIDDADADGTGGTFEILGEAAVFEVVGHVGMDQGAPSVCFSKTLFRSMRAALSPVPEKLSPQ